MCVNVYEDVCVICYVVVYVFMCVWTDVWTCVCAGTHTPACMCVEPEVY